MEENAVVSRQKTANSGRLSVIAAITMLPVMTHGCLNAYLTVVFQNFSNSIELESSSISFRFPGSVGLEKNSIQFFYCSGFSFRQPTLSSEFEPTFLDVWSDGCWTDLGVVGKEKKLFLSVVSCKY